MLLEKQREEVIKIALKAQQLGLIALTFGNFSLRDQETGYVCITPSGMDYEDLEAADIVVMDDQGKIIDGQRKPSVETPMHTMVYRKRKDVCGVVHTHSVFATAWASCYVEFPVIAAELAALVGEPVKTAPYRRMGSMELAEIVSETLQDKHAVLMSNHGLLTVGSNLKTAFANAVIVEEAAKITYYAKNMGQLKILDDQECKTLRKWV
ncbi:MAG: class II aldolase/adducin family protein, partial [Clostridia bacterium]|nr:class II aldolase/adducin family protein [Clostridia bacterium]